MPRPVKGRGGVTIQEDLEELMRTMRRPRSVHSLHILGVIRKADGTKAFVWHEE